MQYLILLILSLFLEPVSAYSQEQGKDLESFYEYSFQNATESLKELRKNILEVDFGKVRNLSEERKLKLDQLKTKSIPSDCLQ